MKKLFWALLLLWLNSSAALAQENTSFSSEALRHPGWGVSFQVAGGATMIPIYYIPAHPSRSADSFASAFRVSRVLTAEHGSGWKRGTLEWDISLVPIDLFFIAGRTYFAGGYEVFSPRWNFTARRGRLVPFTGLAGGMLFSTGNLPPGNTASMNYTIAIDAGVHIFGTRHQSFDATTRLHHLSNAASGTYNPGVPLSLQVMLGYTRY